MVGHHQWLSATTKYLLMLGLPCKLPYEDLSSWCERFDFSKSETCNCLPRTILNIFVFFASPFIHMSIFVVALKITYLGVEICQGLFLGLEKSEMSLLWMFTIYPKLPSSIFNLICRGMSMTIVSAFISGMGGEGGSPKSQAGVHKTGLRLDFSPLFNFRLNALCP